MITDEEKEAVSKMVKAHLSTIEEEESKPRPKASSKHWDRMDQATRIEKMARLKQSAKQMKR